jgi:dolichyl-diphosphooligosaccharide--protein glycosyltransferase
MVFAGRRTVTGSRRAGGGGFRLGAGVAVVGFAVRLLSWAAVFRGGRILYVDADDYCHLRRIMTAIARFPYLPSAERYFSFPAPFRVNWPPLYDIFVAGLALVIGGGAPSERQTMIVAALVPPLVGALTVLLVYRAARQLLGGIAAAWAGAIAATLPMLVQYTVLGRPDHHCAENIWLPAVAALIPWTGESKTRRRAVAAAALLAAGVYCWIGSIMFSAVLGAFAVWERTRRGGEQPSAAPWIGEVLWWEAAMLAPCLLGSRVFGMFDFDAPTAFQPVFVAGLALAVRAAVTGDRRAAVGATLCAGALGIGAAPSLIAFAAAPPPIFRTFSELQPFLRPAGDWSFSLPHACFGLAFWALPLAAYRLAADASRDAPKRLLLIWAGLTGLLALAQTRYAYHFCVPAAMLLGWGAARVQDRLTAAWKSSSRAISAVAAALILLLWPALSGDLALAFGDPNQVTVDPGLIAAAEWLRDHTPPTRSLWSEGGEPEYGVYALHSDGFEIAAIARRPAAAVNWHRMPGPIADSVRFFFLRDDDEAYRFLTERRFRYVVLPDHIGDGLLSGYSRGFGMKGYEATAQTDGRMALSPDVLDLIYERLYGFDGAGASVPGREVASVGRFRLVFESETTRPTKIFEVVPGALVRGSCRRERVWATSKVRVNDRREFLYRAAAFCHGGRFEMRVPYAGSYEVTDGAHRERVIVKDSAVVAGAAAPN